MTQTSYASVPYLILASSEYTSTLSQSQILKFLDSTEINYKCSKLSANISINTCYMYRLYLVIHTSKEFGTYHEAEILSFLQVGIYHLIRRGKSEGNCKIQQKNLPLLSMVESDSLGTFHLQLFHQKVSSGRLHSCNLPPTSGNAELHGLCDYTRSNCGTDGISQLHIAMAHK